MFATPRRVALTATVAAFSLWTPPPALAADAPAAPGVEAIEAFRTGKATPSAVENRFFLKEERFEISPAFGYVPNNPFARRIVGGAFFGYHFNEVLAASGSFGYSPDQGERDLKGLTAVLLDRAYNAQTADGPTFQQPLDKAVVTFSAGVSWAPIYGKINLVGETVLNFDFYGFLGAGMVSKKNFIATYDEQADVEAGQDVVTLTPDINEVKVGPVIGVGQNYFINQTVALKLDARSFFYVDRKPQYDPEVEVLEQRLYNNFTVSIGIALFFPGMKPRLYDF